jgi:hypothetical protein
MRHITDYLTVSQTEQPVSPLHDLKIMGGKDESRTGSAIELFHHIEGHCQLNRSQPNMTTIDCGHDFFEYPILHHFTFI